jgi:tRNA pseudouridine55 synthase
VTVVRRSLGGGKTGHTGTLDPAATGVLPIVIGRATRLAQFLAAGEKEYLAHVRLGAATDTYDATGTVTFEVPEGLSRVSRDALEAALSTFRGRAAQVPPAFSAKQSGGLRAYAEARRGKAIELKAVEVEVFALDLVDVDGPDLTVRLVTSAGFYVRSFAHDLGRLLGTGGHLQDLRRLRTGIFSLDQAVSLEVVIREGALILGRMVGIDHLLPHLRAVRLTQEGCRFVAHGRVLEARVIDGPLEQAEPGLVRLLSPEGRLVGLGEPRPDGTLHPALVLV